MACLLSELEDHPKQISKECYKLLERRKQLWELAAQVCIFMMVLSIYMLNLEEIFMSDCYFSNNHNQPISFFTRLRSQDIRWKLEIYSIRTVCVNEIKIFLENLAL